MVAANCRIILCGHFNNRKKIPTYPGVGVGLKQSKVNDRGRVIDTYAAIFVFAANPKILMLRTFKLLVYVIIVIIANTPASKSHIPRIFGENLKICKFSENF